MFYREGTPIAAIEVFATHAVDEQKRADLERFSVPWIEVKAAEDLYYEDYGWTPSQPLPFVNCAPALPSWTCDRCLHEPEKYPARVAKWIEQANERQRQDWQKHKAERAADQVRREQDRRSREALASAIRRYANVVFTYQEDGTKSTHFFYITYKKSKHVTEEITLQYGPDFEDLAHVAVPNISIQMIQDRFNEYIAEFQKNCVYVVSATSWMPLESVASFIEKWESPYIWDVDKWVKRS